MSDAGQTTHRLHAVEGGINATRVTTADECAARGAHRIGLQDPDWWETIYVSCLEMRSVGHCVLGQWAGSFNGGLERLGLDGTNCHHYGFDVADEEDEDFEKYQFGYEELDQAWRKIILENREVAL
jgi:hypothetical protein